MYEQRPWLKLYPAGIPANIDTTQYVSLIQLVEASLKKYADRIAYSNMDATLTYRQVDEMSMKFASYLHSRGLEPGDRIALMMPNLLQYPVALFGALRAGLVIVNTNPLYTAREMKYQFTDSGVKAIVIAEMFAHNLEKILHETDIKIVITTSVGELMPALKGSIVNFVIRYIKRMVPKYTIPNTVSFRHALKEGVRFTLKPFNGRHEDVILFQYTGGTTGVAKGAMLTNENLIANMLQISAILVPKMNEENEVVLSPLPMYHIFAFTLNVSMLNIGTKIVMVTNARDLGSVIKEFKKHPISLMTGVNTLFNALMNHKDFAASNFQALKLTIGGGMAVQQAVAKKWHEVTKCFLTEAYGLTETSPGASVSPLDGSGLPGSIGLPFPSTDMRIVDEEGVPVPVGEVGEVQIKGPQVMKGYYNKLDETANVMKDGWLCTGDMGLMTLEGFFKIVDRKKDMILVSGFNVYPNEIEDVAAMHPKVLESAAVGVPDEKSGELVKLFVVKKDQSLTKDELLDHCRENLTSYKMPKFIEFRDELPKTNVGKILRRELRDDK